jgi:transcriptional antiterminator RfaH
MMKWYAVHCLPNAERKAQQNLAQQGIESYLPYYVKTRRHARKAEQVRAPLFPRYIFVRLDVECQRWRMINSTFGVSHLVCSSDHPAALPDKVVAEIRNREGDDGAVKLGRLIQPKPGDRIRFVDGPMLDQIGIFECERDEDRVVILLSLLGRVTRVTASSDVIASCA